MEKENAERANKTLTFKQESGVVLNALKIIGGWVVSFSIKVFNFMVLIAKKITSFSMKLFERITK